MSDENKNKAARYNSGKVRLTFNLPLLEELEARVSEFGSVKYADFNWVKGGPLSDPVNSLKRHLAGLQAGQWLDLDSGLPHAAHCRWNAGQMLQWHYTGVLEWDLPKFTYLETLAADLLTAEQKLKEAREKYAKAREEAGLG